MMIPCRIISIKGANRSIYFLFVEGAGIFGILITLQFIYSQSLRSCRTIGVILSSKSTDQLLYPCCQRMNNTFPKSSML